MRATIKNKNGQNMFLSTEIDVLKTPKELICLIVEKHPLHQRLLGAMNVELLKNKALFIDDVDMSLLVDGKEHHMDKDSTIFDYMLEHRDLFNNIEPTFLVDISYTTEDCSSNEDDIYADNLVLMSKCFASLAFDGLHRFSFSPHSDENGITSADMKVTVQGDYCYHYKIYLNCQGYNGKSMYRSYEYKSNSITDEDAKHAVKRAILYDEIDNATYGLKMISLIREFALLSPT